jgi:hypothetical protein
LAHGFYHKTNAEQNRQRPQYAHSAKIHKSKVTTISIEARKFVNHVCTNL